MKDNLLYQMEMVLGGEASLLEQAHAQNINIERVEEQIRRILAEKRVFGSDDVMDVVMCGYVIGRRDQFFATVQGLVGQEELQKLYGQVCLKLGINPRVLN
jgi:hypothetical protein